jgi:RNA recognition motif-containing protein
MNIYVGNLAYSVSEQDLVTAFSKFGVVNSAKLIMDRDSGRAKGFGFVEMENKSEAIKAIGQLNGTELAERALVVNEARPREDRSASSGNRGHNRY